eukprot:6939102-Prymnesium_polylepis.1
MQLGALERRRDGRGKKVAHAAQQNVKAVRVSAVCRDCTVSEPMACQQGPRRAGFSSRFVTLEGTCALKFNSDLSVT